MSFKQITSASLSALYFLKRFGAELIRTYWGQYGLEFILDLSGLQSFLPPSMPDKEIGFPLVSRLLVTGRAS